MWQVSADRGRAQFADDFRKGETGFPRRGFSEGRSAVGDFGFALRGAVLINSTVAELC